MSKAKRITALAQNSLTAGEIARVIYPRGATKGQLRYIHAILGDGPAQWKLYQLSAKGIATRRKRQNERYAQDEEFRRRKKERLRQWYLRRKNQLEGG